MNRRIIAWACIVLFIAPASAAASGETARNGRVPQEWELVGELDATVRIPSGGHYSAWFDNATGSFREQCPYQPLSAQARLALNMTPDWIRGDLERTFLELGFDMNRYANVITGLGDARLVDETAFAIAHTSPDILRTYAYAGIFSENAASIYSADQNLSYVRLVEKANGTTAAYINASGVERELPMDIYYWFIVHPKITDERPAYIDPASGSQAAPPTGKFWRDYLMNHNDSGYPLLKDALSGVPRIWNGTRNNSTDNGAVGTIIRWIQDVMDFGSGTERPVQPVRIYALHLGRCGEHEDITCAAARAALIPCIGCDDLAEDHVWNEFWYDGRWVHWEPVNNMVDSPGSYAGWGKKFPAVTAWRGDDFTWQETGVYTQTCTLKVTVKDSAGRPVEGAAVWVGNEYSADNRFRMIAGWNSTNASGMAEFALGRNNTIYARVDSEKLAGAPTAYASNTGANPYVLAGTDTAKVISDAQPIQYNYTFTLSNAAIPKKNGYTEDAALQGNYRLELTLKAQDSEVVGRNVLLGTHYYTDDSQTPIHSFFASDAEYRNYNLSQGFRGWGFSNGTDLTGNISVPDNGKWHIVVGSDATSAIQCVHITARFYVKPFIMVLVPANDRLFCGGKDIIISGTADASDVSNVELSVDGGTSWKDGNFNASSRTWKYVWNTSAVSSGNYSVMSRLLHGGDVLPAEPLAVRIDADNPSVAAPRGGIMKGGGAIRLEGGVSDNTGVALVEISIEGPNQAAGWIAAALCLGNTSWSLEWQTGHLGSGNYTVTARATDVVGRTRDASVNITLDFDAPTATFSTAGLFRGGGTIRLEGTATDNILLANVTISGTGAVSDATVEAGRWSLDWNTSGLPSGKYQLTATAADAAGWTATASSTIVLDADAPEIDVDWPQNAEAGSVVTLTGNIRDEKGLDVSEISTDGENWTGLDPDDGGDWSFDWDTSALMPGNYSISVRASDKVGNPALAADNVMLVDTTPPQVSVDMPKEIVGGDVLVVKVKVSERTGIGAVGYSTDGKGWMEIAPGPKGYSVELNTACLSLGKNKIRIRAYDIAGNMGTADKDVTVIDDRAPVLAIADIQVVKRQLTASGSASDNYRMKSLEYTTDGARWTALDFANGSWNLTLANIKPGKYVFKVRATDASGLTTEASRDFEIKAPATAKKGFLTGFGSELAIMAFAGTMAATLVSRARRKSQKG